MPMVPAYVILIAGSETLQSLWHTDGLPQRRSKSSHIERGRLAAPQGNANPGKAPKRPKPKLSFEDEMEDDLGATQAFSLAANTARK